MDWDAALNLRSLEKQYGLPQGLLTAVYKTESAGDPKAVSPVGAQGLFQFMPDTAKQYGIDPFDPQQAAVGAAKMFSDLNSKYNGHLPSVLAGYNWGQGNVDRLGLDQAPAETRNYITKITQNLNPLAANVDVAPQGGYGENLRPHDPALLQEMVKRGLIEDNSKTITPVERQPLQSPQASQPDPALLEELKRRGLAPSDGEVAAREFLQSGDMVEQAGKRTAPLFANALQAIPIVGPYTDEAISAVGALPEITKGLDAYRRMFSGLQEAQAGLRKVGEQDNPDATLATQINTGVASLAMPFPFLKGKTALGTIAKNAGIGAVAGAAHGFGGGDGIDDRLNKAADSALWGAAGTAALFGAGIGLKAAAPVVAPVVERAGSGLKRFGELFGAKAKTGTSGSQTEAALKTMETQALDPSRNINSILKPDGTPVNLDEPIMPYRDARSSNEAFQSSSSSNLPRASSAPLNSSSPPLKSSGPANGEMIANAGSRRDGTQAPVSPSQETVDTGLSGAGPQYDRTSPSALNGRTGIAEPSLSKPIVYQNSNDVKQILDLAGREKPQIESDFNSLANGIPGAKFEGARLKDLGRLNEKFANKEPSAISDYLGARFVADTPQAIDDLVAGLQKNHVVREIDNKLAGGQGGYRAVHLQVESPNGLSYEVQIMPREMREAYNKAHPIYQKIRNSPDLTREQRSKLRDQARVYFDEAAAKWQKRTGGGETIKADEAFPLKTAGQRTQDAELQRLENEALAGTLGSEAQQNATGTIAKQTEQFKTFLQRLGGDITRGRDTNGLIDGILDTIQANAKAAKDAVSGAYAYARKGAGGVQNGVKIQREDIQKGLWKQIGAIRREAQYDVSQMPRAQKVIKRLARYSLVSKMQKVTPTHLAELEAWRTMATTAAQDAQGSEQRFLRQMVRAYDNFMEKTAENAALEGDREAIMAFRNAISKRAEYGRKFEDNELVADMVSGQASVDDIRNRMIGTGSLKGRREMANNLRAIVKAAGSEAPKVKKDMQNAFAKHLMQRSLSDTPIPGTDNLAISPRKLQTALSDLFESQSEFARELYGEQAVEQAKRAIVELNAFKQQPRIGSTSGSGEELTRTIGRIVDSIPMVGQITRGVKIVADPLQKGIRAKKAIQSLSGQIPDGMSSIDKNTEPTSKFFVKFKPVGAAVFGSDIPEVRVYKKQGE